MVDFKWATMKNENAAPAAFLRDGETKQKWIYNRVQDGGGNSQEERKQEKSNLIQETKHNKKNRGRWVDGKQEGGLLDVTISVTKRDFVC